MSASASPPAGSPLVICSSATMLRPGSWMRASGPFSACSSGAPGCIAASGSNTAGSTSYSTSQRAAARLRRRLALRQHAGDALADEAHHVVQHPRIGRIVQRILMPRRGERPQRRRPTASARYARQGSPGRP